MKWFHLALLPVKVQKLRIGNLVLLVMLLISAKTLSICLSLICVCEKLSATDLFRVMMLHKIKEVEMVL